MDEQHECYTWWDKVQLLWELITAPHWLQCTVYTAIMTISGQFEPKGKQNYSLTVYFDAEGSRGALAGPDHESDDDEGGLYNTYGPRH